MSLRLQTRLIKLLLTVLFSAFGLLMIMPFLWMLSSSFKLPSEMFRYPIEWIPKTWHFSNYKEVWAGKYPFLLYYWNTTKITVLTVLGCLVTASMAGFAFAKLNFKGRDVLFLLYLATMIIPSQILLVPRFILFDFLGMINTHASIILPGTFTVLGTFIMRQFFSTLPNELLEACKVDGAGYVRMFVQIALPLSKPALVSLLIITFTWHWNEFENPLIFLRDNAKYTIPLGLTNYVDENVTEYSLIMAASVSALLPLILLVSIFQRWFIEGIASTGLKG